MDEKISALLNKVRDVAKQVRDPERYQNSAGLSWSICNEAEELIKICLAARVFNKRTSLAINKALEVADMRVEEKACFFEGYGISGTLYFMNRCIARYSLGTVSNPFFGGEELESYRKMILKTKK